MKVKVNVKGVSNRQNKIETAYFDYSEAVNTLEEFLTSTVKICVADYNKRQKDSDILKVLSPENIENQSQTGKVSFGVNYGGKRADEKKAVENALQCFRDGIVAVFIDGDRKEYLTDTVLLTEDSEVTFVRLTFLSGRMW